MGGSAPDRATEMPDWPFPHPSRGTCRAGCERYGACHCGCGRATTISVLTDAEHDRFKGRPFVFTSGHHARVFRRHGGAWTKRGVSADRVRPLIFWLRDRLGSIRAVAEALGVPESTVRGYVYKRRLKRVPPEAAHAVSELVLLHRPQSADPLSRWELDELTRWRQQRSHRPAARATRSDTQRRRG